MRRGRIRQAVAWVAVLCVYGQLALVAICAAGTFAAGFPICHALQGASHSDDHAPPAPDNPCPLCAAHCHTLAVTAPSFGRTVRIEIASVVIEMPTSSIGATPPDVTGASPRGPPVAA